MKTYDRNVVGKAWTNWHWQQQHAATSERDITDYFTAIDPTFWTPLFGPTAKNLKFQVTPYMLTQLPPDISQEELIKNPWFLQFFPQGEIYTTGHDAYGVQDNWENSEDFPTRDIQHKYTNRVLVRLRNCLAYCNFCFEALGTLEKDPSADKSFSWKDWQASLDYIATHPDVEEVILSGGEPLLLSDSKLENILSDIQEIRAVDGNKKIRFTRIHTRVLTHNPYRITDELVDILRRQPVNEIALHVAHPSEFTPEFFEGVNRIRGIGGGYAPLLVTHTPLLRGINDRADVLWELFAKAFEHHIKPYYLLHSMPHVPFADKQRVSVRDGVRLVKELKRHKSNIALPEYVIVHYDGKQTVPLEVHGTPEFQYTQDVQGNPTVRFLNWQNKWVEYPDIDDTIK